QDLVRALLVHQGGGPDVQDPALECIRRIPSVNADAPRGNLANDRVGQVEFVGPALALGVEHVPFHVPQFVEVPDLVDARSAEEHQEEGETTDHCLLSSSSRARALWAARVSGNAGRIFLKEASSFRMEM